MKISSRKEFTPGACQGESDENLQITGGRTYTEPDFMNKSRKITIKIWPYLPSHTVNSSDNPAVYQ